jgi:hypothetical protein
MSRLDAAFFLSDIPVSRNVTLADGSTHAFCFRDLSAQRWADYHTEIVSDDPEVSNLAPYRLIADCVCMPDGGEALTVEEARRLKAPVVAALRRACMDANGLTKKEKNA